MCVCVCRDKENLSITGEVNCKTWKKAYVHSSFTYNSTEHSLALRAAEKQVLINFKMFAILLLFECFEIDHNLPKQLKKESNEGQKIASHCAFAHC